MHIEEKYKLVKEKYKEVKEQNDILKKAILEYKNDIKELEKGSNEKTNKINDLVHEKQVLLNNNKQLSNKIAQLSAYLDEQKKNNSGWRNLRLLKKSSQEFDNSAVAYEELENKIHENETLHKQIEALQNDSRQKENEIEAITKTFHSQLKEKEQVIKLLNEKFEESTSLLKKIEREKEKIIKQTETNKEQFDETIKKEKQTINQLETFCTKLKSKYYNKYKIAFDKIPFFEKCDMDNYNIQNEILETTKQFQLFILNIIDKCIEYLSVSKQLFIFPSTDLNTIYKSVETDTENNSNDYSKIKHLVDIAKNEVFFFDEVIHSLAEFKRKWTHQESTENLNGTLNVLSNKTKRLFIKVHTFLYVEEYYFPTEVHTKKFRLKNVNREIRNLKKAILHMINLFAFVIFAVPYNNQDIISEYFKKTRIKKKIDENDPSKYVYYTEALYTELSNSEFLSEGEDGENDGDNYGENYGENNVGKNNVGKNNVGKNNEGENENNGEAENNSKAEGSEEKQKKALTGRMLKVEEIRMEQEELKQERKLETKQKINWKGEEHNENIAFKRNKLDASKFILEKEKASLSKYEHLKKYADRNNKIISFLIKKWKNMCNKFLSIFEFLRSYISFRMCERKNYGSLNFGDSRKFSNLLDLTNYFIHSMECFEINIFRVFFISIFSYYRFHNFLNFTEEQNFLKMINQAFNQTTPISFSFFQKSLKDLKWYQKNYSKMNKSLCKKKQIIKLLKTVNRQAMHECKSISLQNCELQANNEALKNTLSTNRQTLKDTETRLKHADIGAEDIRHFIIANGCENKSFTVKEKQLLEAYILSCAKINKLIQQLEQHNTSLLHMENELQEKEQKNKILEQQIKTYKEEETNIQTKYEEQMNTLHDLIVSLEKQITRLNSEKGINKFLVICSFCDNKNSIEHILKNRKCSKCNSIILFSK